MDSQIEAILFWKGEPQSIKKLAASLGKKEEEIVANLEVLKDKIKGRVVTLCGRDVGIGYRNGYYIATDIKTGLSLDTGNKDTTEKSCIKEAEKTMDILIGIDKSKLQKKIEKFESLPIAEKNKIIVRKSERLVSGMLNYRYFECSITDGEFGAIIELKDANLFSGEECDMIIDQITERIGE